MATRKEMMSERWQKLKEKLAREIKPDELLKMKTLSRVKKTVAEKDLGRIGSTLILLETLERQNVVYKWDVDTLIEILEDIGRSDLALEVIKYKDELGRYYFYPEFFQSLQESSQRDETRKNLYRGRVMLVGAYGAGKTSTKRSLFKEPYKTEHLSTDGADVFSIDITEWIIKESTTEYKGNKSIIETQKLLTDVLISGMAEDPFMGTTQQDTQKTTTAEVADVLDAVKLEGERMSEAHGRLYLQYDEKLSGHEIRSEKSDVYFSLWDFAGQSIYYITHQVFLSSQVIYILVTDLTKSLDDTLPVGDGEYWTVKQFLSFWMNSIHTHASQESQVCLKQSDGSFKMAVAPPVIILGTKKDLLRQKNTTKDVAAVDVNKEAQKRLLEIKEYLAKHATKAVNAHLVDMIAIDNKSRNEDGSIADPAVETLRLKIQQLAKEYLFLGSVQAKWILLELSLRKLRKEKISLDEVKDLGKRMKMEEAEVIEALDFYHSVGELLYHKAVPELKNTVILDVGWLVSLFKILINQSITYKEELDVPVQHISQIKELHYEGRLHDDLLDYLLLRHNRHEDKEILLKMMELYDIICEMPLKHGEKEMYYLPSLMQMDAEGKSSDIFPASRSVCCQLYFHFIGNFLPEGLFYRLLIRCIRRWSDCTVVLRKHMARLYFPYDDFHLTLCKEGADIQLKILVFPVSGRYPSPPQPKHVRNVRQLIKEDLRLVMTTYTPSLVYKTCLKCNCPNHRLGESLPGSEDTDDRCAPVSDDRTESICPRSAMPLTDQKLNMWYRTEVKHNVRGHQEASDQAFEEQMKTTRNVQFTPADKNPRYRCFQLPSGFILQVPAGYPELKNIETHVRCRETANGLSLEDYEFYQSDVIEFPPECSEFGEPVRLMRKCLKLGPYDRVLQILRSNDGETWHEIETTVENGHVVALVTKLSMFVAISKPYQDRFPVDERAKVLTSSTNPGVSIEVPKNALEEKTTIEMEVHNIDYHLLNDIYVSNNLQNVASVSPLVCVNRHKMGGKLHFKQPVTLSISLPPEMPSTSLDYTKLCIVKDELCNDDWRDVTGKVQHKVVDGAIRITTDTLSRYIVVFGRLGTIITSVAADIVKAITNYLKSGCHSVKILLVQNRSNDCLLLCDLIDKATPTMEKILTDDPKYRQFFWQSTPYTSTISFMNGDIVRNELSRSTKENFEITTDMNEHKYRPNDSNHWFVTVRRNSNALYRSSLFSSESMCFYKEKDARPIAELPFFPRGRINTIEAPEEISEDTEEPGSSGQATHATDLDRLSVLFCTLRDKLTEEDTRRIINLLTPKQISRHDAEKLRDSYDVFSYLRECKYISEEDLTVLKNVFTNLNKPLLVDHIDDFLRKNKTK